MNQLLFGWTIEFIKCSMFVYGGITIFEALPSFFGVKVSTLKRWWHIPTTSTAVPVYILAGFYVLGERLSVAQIMLSTIVYFGGSIVGLVAHKFWPLNQIVRR